MAKRDWLERKHEWRLSSTFKVGARSKVQPPLVGTRVGELVITGAWTNNYGTIKAYQADCDCGRTETYMKVDEIKLGIRASCNECHAPRHEAKKRARQSESCSLKSTLHFKKVYGLEMGERLCILYNKKHERGKSRLFPNGIPFYEPWKTDFAAFAEYIVAIPGFYDTPKLELDRIDNSKGYTPGNLKFSDRYEQLRNRDITRFCEFRETRYAWADFIRMVLGPNYHESPKLVANVRSRLTKGHSTESIVRQLANNEIAWDYEPVRKYFAAWFASLDR